MASVFGSRHPSPYARRYYPSISQPPTPSFVSSTSRPKLLPKLTPQPPTYDLPILTINSFIRDASSSSSSYSPLALTLSHVPYSAVDRVQSHLNHLASDAAHGIAKVVRLDYNGDSRTLIISCPGFAHEVVSGFPRLILEHVNAQSDYFYGNLKSDSRYHIVDSGSTTIKLTSASGKTSSRQPDGSLCLGWSTIPFLVCEVADHQKLRDLKRKAPEYITGTRGAVRIVILIKLERQKPPKKQKRKPKDDRNIHGGSGSGSAPLSGEVSPVDEQDPGRVSDPEDDPEELVKSPTEPLAGPASRQLIRGVFWVYTYRVDPTPKLVCLENEREFYPMCPPSSLELSWSNILDPPPEELRDRVVSIPYSVLYDRVLWLTEPEPELPGVHPDVEFGPDADYGVTGLQFSSDPSEPLSEVSEADDEMQDPSFEP